MDHRELEEAVAAYALGALDDAERVETERALVEHLPGCASCRELLADFREVAGDLALVTPARALPDEVGERIMAQVLEEERPAAARGPGRVRRRIVSRLGVAAAIVAVAALGAWNVQLASRVDDAEESARAVAQAATLLAAPDARTASVVGDRGSLVFMWRPGEAVLLGHDVEAPDSGRVLQVWLMRSGVPTSAGVFRPSDGLVVVPIPIDPRGFDRVAITVERGPRGAARPSSAPIYSGLLTA
jgi:anti-sigma-K factor RskA